MPVENNVHHRAPITVADRSGAKPGAAPHKPGPARPTSGNANAPVTPLADINADPKGATTYIDRGLFLVRQGKTAEGEVQLQKGIEVVVERLAGKQNLNNYDQVKLATAVILKTHGGRNAKDKAATVNAVNEYVQRTKVIDGLLHAKTDDEKKQAKVLAASYVTDIGPDRMSPGGRLIFLTDHMSKAGVDKNIVDAVIREIRPHRKAEIWHKDWFVIAFKEIKNNSLFLASSWIKSGIEIWGLWLFGQDFYHDFARASFVTGRILDFYSGEGNAVKDALVKGVNLHLQMVVGDNLHSAKNRRELDQAMQTAVKYVIDTAGPNTMQPRERLAGLIDIMTNSYGLNAKTIADVKAQCEKKIGSK